MYDKNKRGISPLVYWLIIWVKLDKYFGENKAKVLNIPTMMGNQITIFNPISDMVSQKNYPGYA